VIEETTSDFDREKLQDLIHPQRLIIEKASEHD
jgi:hypothetical protein